MICLHPKDLIFNENNQCCQQFFFLSYVTLLLFVAISKLKNEIKSYYHDKLIETAAATQQYA